jgi:hypothetical protein
MIDPGSPPSIKAALEQIPEDSNGIPDSADPNKIEVHAASVSFASNNSGYPTECPLSSPAVMYATVAVTSGYTQQLRNVYIQITDTSSGLAFCSKDSPGTFALTPNVGLYLYDPLDAGVDSALRRTKRWAMYLPNNSPFWFSGVVVAEVIPKPITNWEPIDGTPYQAASTKTVTLKWTQDPLGDAGDPEGFDVFRPDDGAVLTVDYCLSTSATQPLDNDACWTNRVQDSWQSPSYRMPNLPTDTWWRWKAQQGFFLPGNSDPTLFGSQQTRYFRIYR